MKAVYDLELIQELVSKDRNNLIITRSAREDAFLLNMDETDIADCVCSFLTEDDFYKTMPSKTKAPLWQDVYKFKFRGYPIYLKLQITQTGKVVVVSFKLK